MSPAIFKQPLNYQWANNDVMLKTSFCCQLGAILQKDFSKMTTTPPVTEWLHLKGFAVLILLQN
jgi:hypothetical protein